MKPRHTSQSTCAVYITLSHSLIARVAARRSHWREQVSELRPGLGLHAEDDDERDEADVENALHRRPNVFDNVANLQGTDQCSVSALYERGAGRSSRAEGAAVSRQGRNVSVRVWRAACNQQARARARRMRGAQTQSSPVAVQVAMHAHSASRVTFAAAMARWVSATPPSRAALLRTGSRSPWTRAIIPSRG